MNILILGGSGFVGTRLTYWLGLLGGDCFDLLVFLICCIYSVSLVRVKKFFAQTVFSSEKIQKSGFKSPFDMQEALHRTIHFEFDNQCPK